jgi:glyoxylate/hydroxypyruvate reductase A|tara:strand:+ start:763 stop:969 length:207 start_codon:yes stop_codon:yes gene_type:complete
VLPENFLAMFPKLRVIFSIGAGVDQFDISEIPEAVKVVRMLDPGIADCVAKYVTLATLTLHRRIPQCL